MLKISGKFHGDDDDELLMLAVLFEEASKMSEELAPPPRFLHLRKFFLFPLQFLFPVVGSSGMGVGARVGVSG